MYQILVILTIILTLTACFVKPDLHKPLMVYDYEYKIVQIDDNKKNEPKETSEILPLKTEEKASPKTVETKEIKTIPSKTAVSSTKKVQSQNVNKTNLQNKTVNKPQKTVSTGQTAKKPDTATSSNTIQNVTPKKQAETKQGAPVQNSNTYETEEEKISWNKWRSDIQNQIMKDVKLPQIQTGTIFKFQFDVDKFGKISNIQTYSTNAFYTPYAIQYIAPVIKSYQGRDIVKFPANSKRFQTTFTGSLRISNVTKLSKPEDYNDMEKIIK